MEHFTDFPKLESPFKRKYFPISEEDFNKYRRKYNLRSPSLKLVTPEVEEGYEWVFEDDNTIATEKLDGTNISISLDPKGNIASVRNRKNPILLFNIHKVDTRFVEGLMNAIDRKYLTKCNNDTYFGELVGPKLQGNMYNLQKHVWYPFFKAVESLKYKSFHKYERTFDNLSFWFKGYLYSIFYARYNNIDLKKGVLFQYSFFY